MKRPSTKIQAPEKDQTSSTKIGRNRTFCGNSSNWNAEGRMQNEEVGRPSAECGIESEAPSVHPPSRDASARQAVGDGLCGRPGWLEIWTKKQKRILF